jgi:hypothetical protein
MLSNVVATTRDLGFIVQKLGFQKTKTTNYRPKSRTPKKLGERNIAPDPRDIVFDVEDDIRERDVARDFAVVICIECHGFGVTPIVVQVSDESGEIDVELDIGWAVLVANGKMPVREAKGRVKVLIAGEILRPATDDENRSRRGKNDPPDFDRFDNDFSISGDIA